jgi:MinD superfamily P-loop ATPase
VKIVITSGKGGTGKTMLSVNLAVALATEQSVGLLDCDVEEPNCHLFLKPDFGLSQPVDVTVPVVDEESCTSCGRCARACEFHALVALPGKPPLFLPEMCHGCGLCKFICAEEAVSDGRREIGSVGAGGVHGLYFRRGQLYLGEARCTPLIQAVKDPLRIPPLDTLIIDSPPGVACPAVETLKGADFVVLVAEPTPFGLHDLRLAVQITEELSIPFGVVINRSDIGNSGVHDFCVSESIPILLEIPFEREIAEISSRGVIYADVNDAFAEMLRKLARDIAARLPEIEAVALPERTVVS